jgi:hypothetical protein
MANSTDKLIFFYDAFKSKREIAAHIFNDVFCEFEDKFMQGKPYKSVMANFKKYMKLAAENRGHEVVVLRVNKFETIVQGTRNLWSVQYRK